MVYKKMHLQENTLYDLDRGVRVTQNVAQYTLHHVTYSLTTLEAATSNNLEGNGINNKLHYLTLGFTF